MFAPKSPRRYARTTRPYRVSICFAGLSLLGLVALAGCGGGGGGSHSTPPPTSVTSELNGTVTDANIAPIVGASVTFGTKTATSTQSGAYLIPNVTIPSGQTSLVGVVSATATVKGIAYSGQNQVELLSSDATTRNAHIVMSPTATQGSIIGVVLDAGGKGVPNARVYANDGPTTNDSGVFLTNLGAFNTTSRADGSFTLPSIPSGSKYSYTVTASLAGSINQTVKGVAVQSATSTSVTLTLSTYNSANGASTVPTPGNLFASTITAPLSATRAAGTAGTSEGFLNVIRRMIRQKHTLATQHIASAQKTALHRSVTRATPSGSLIETNFYWDYIDPTKQTLDNVLGFDILRAPDKANSDPTVHAPGTFVSIATIRDPLADFFADNDPALTPDNYYYYSVAALDTINFPQSGAEGDPAVPVTVVPLNVLGPGSVNVSATPTFTWSTVNRVTLYKVLVYDQFPTLQSDTDANGVQPIWSADFSGTSGAYAGTPLTSGHTYYWTIVGQDSVGSAFTLSPLQTFVAK